jgi:hypothetical protein
MKSEAVVVVVVVPSAYLTRIPTYTFSSVYRPSKPDFPVKGFRICP